MGGKNVILRCRPRRIRVAEGGVMLKEERELLVFCRSTWFECRETIVDEDGYKKEKRLIRALVKAVREDERSRMREIPAIRRMR
jgi:hypothetical protein